MRREADQKGKAAFLQLHLSAPILGHHLFTSGLQLRLEHLTGVSPPSPRCTPAAPHPADRTTGLPGPRRQSSLLSPQRCAHRSTGRPNPHSAAIRRAAAARSGRMGLPSMRLHIRAPKADKMKGTDRAALEFSHACQLNYKPSTSRVKNYLQTLTAFK